MIRGIGITTTTVGKYMTDHIRDLARKAGLIAPYGSDHEGLRDFDYRMFADLIVKECLGLTDGHGNIRPEDVKKHFGVE
jgi:hypothetical protein